MYAVIVFDILTAHHLFSRLNSRLNKSCCFWHSVINESIVYRRKSVWSNKKIQIQIQRRKKFVKKPAVSIQLTISLNWKSNESYTTFCPWPVAYLFLNMFRCHWMNFWLTLMSSIFFFSDFKIKINAIECSKNEVFLFISLSFTLEFSPNSHTQKIWKKNRKKRNAVRYQQQNFWIS